ncbi:hypothetical protein [Candidatus Halobonum tyrrellensis]|uniref:DUF2800 domain-containing protein n=1 Tax=Candidatus Halobonum tyrrellensis G22 TaxID=1324957 RepID=V4HJ96_9EURY|nr:hypothetical protein [Candidatus Halobonum tyrrellensis]ESP89823.1 hypothetical protein K933_02531 [Candidatus Halobonum tyrrellensis G22]
MSVGHEERWNVIQERCATLEPGTELVTPLSNRPFRVREISTDRLQIRFDDSSEKRPLWREQFEVLTDRLAEQRLAVAELPPGVEPYATILTLLADFGVEDGELAYVSDPEMGGGSPYLVSPADARTRPERLHDDAILLADLLDTSEPVDPETLDTGTLTDLYVLLSDVQHEADRLRQTARESLLSRLGADQELHGRFGTVRRTTRERRRPKDDETIFDVLSEHEIPREWVLGVDPDKLDVVLTATGLEEDDVYDVEEQVYVQKTEVEEDEKYSRFRGLAERIEEVDGEEGEELRADLRDLEARLDEALSA